MVRMRIEYLILSILSSIFLYGLLQVNAASAVACGQTSSGQVFYSGPIDCGTVTNLGTANITDGAVVDIAPLKPCIGCSGGNLDNRGTLNVGPLNQGHPYGGTLNVRGGLQNDGTININGTVKQDGTIDRLKSGTVVIDSIYASNNNTINMAPGSILTSCANCGAGPGQISGAGTVNINGGTLSGPLTINGNVVNLGGTVQPSGTLTLGSYTQGGNGRLSFNIGGLLAGTQYDVLKVNGPISINGGSVQVSLVNNFQPKVGDKFEILTGNIQRIGLSSPISLPTLPAGEFWGRANFGSFFELSVQQVQPSVVGSPEPGSFLLIGSGFAWLMGSQWRKHARSMQAVRS